MTKLSLERLYTNYFKIDQQKQEKHNLSVWMNEGVMVSCCGIISLFSHHYKIWIVQKRQRQLTDFVINNNFIFHVKIVFH